MWNTLSYNIGVLHPKEKRTISFVYRGNIKVTTIEASCGCTNVNWNENTNTLFVTFVASKIPKQVLDRGDTSYKRTVSVTVKAIVEGIEKVFILYMRAEIKQHE